MFGPFLHNTHVKMHHSCMFLSAKFLICSTLNNAAQMSGHELAVLIIVMKTNTEHREQYHQDRRPSWIIIPATSISKITWQSRRLWPRSHDDNLDENIVIVHLLHPREKSFSKFPPDGATHPVIEEKRCSNCC